MIRGIGMDLCEIDRLTRAIQNPRFFSRVFSEGERIRVLNATGERRGEIAAGIFAAKEAVSKMLGTGFTGFGPSDVEITRAESGCPACALHGGAAARAAAIAGDGFRIHISITHDAGIAAATAILEAD